MSTISVSPAHLVAIRDNVLAVLGELDLLLGRHDATSGPPVIVPPVVTAVLESTGSGWQAGFVSVDGIAARATALGRSHDSKAALLADVAAKFPGLPAPALPVNSKPGSRKGFPAIATFAAVNSWYYERGLRLPWALWARYADVPQWLDLLPFLAEVAATIDEPITRDTAKSAFAAAGRTMPTKFRQQILAAVRATHAGQWPWMPSARRPIQAPEAGAAAAAGN